MTKAECQPRSSGMLSPKDQIVAQELFNSIQNEVLGIAVNTSPNECWMINIQGAGKKGSRMEIDTESSGEGQITVKFRKGKKYWHDDGSEGFAGFFGDASKVEPESFHPSVATRDSVLRQAHDIFVKPQLQSR